MKINHVYFPDHLTYNEVEEELLNRIHEVGEKEVISKLSEDQLERLSRSDEARWYIIWYFKQNPSREFNRLTEAYEEYTGNSWLVD